MDKDEVGTFTKMFGFIWQQPIYQTLLDLRIIFILSLLACFALIYDMWQWYKKTMEDLIANNLPIPTEWDNALFYFMLGVLGILYKVYGEIKNGVIVKESEKPKRNSHDRSNV